MRVSFVFVTCAAALALGLPDASSQAEAATSSWRRLDAPHRKSTRAEVARQLQRDGVPQPERLLQHRYLVRVEISRAGGGTALHSEVVIRFRSLPKRVLAKAENPGGPQPGRAQVGAFSDCKTRPGAVGRTCPVKYNGKGWVDVTRAFTHRNMLFVHDPRRKARGRTVLWFAADRSQRYMWYYIVPKKSWPTFGSAQIRVRKYLLPEPARPAPLPESPRDAQPRRPANPTPATPPRPRPEEDGRSPAGHPIPLPRRAVRTQPNQWTAVANAHERLRRAQLAARIRKDGLAHPGYLLAHKYLVRLALRNAGGGSLSRSELQLRFIAQPAKALGKAWADRPGIWRGQLGPEDRCRPRPADRGGPESRDCPVQFSGLGWRNVIGAFSSVRMRLVVDPNDNGQGNMVLWLAFDSPQTGTRYRFVSRPALPSLGQGEVSVRLFALEEGADARGPDGSSGPGAAPRPEATAPEGWRRIGGWAHRPAARRRLAARMRRDGVAYPAFLLRHKYVVRLAITGAGDARSRRSEILLRMDAPPRAALGVAWADHRRRWAAQVGPVERCRPLPAARNPYGGAGTESPRGHVCPVQYGGLGWRNLTAALGAKEVMLITAPWRAGQGNQLLWLAFDRPQPGLAVRPARGMGGAMHASVKAEKFVVGAAPDDPSPSQGGADRAPDGPRRPAGAAEAPPTWKPVPSRSPSTPTAPTPGNAGWKTVPGAHLQVARNALYWTIRRDGFTNPWYLLKHHYLVRIELFARDRRAETRLRLTGPPRLAVGVGTAAGRSGIQAGPTARCRRGPGKPAFCPLHYGNLGWRNLISGVGNADLLVVTDPGGYGRQARTVIWLAFDTPQTQISYRPLQVGSGEATVRIQRYRY